MTMNDSRCRMASLVFPEKRQNFQNVYVKVLYNGDRFRQTNYNG